jgi:hypothetical protein
VRFSVLFAVMVRAASVVVRLIVIDNKISWDGYAGPRFDNLYSHGNIIRNQEFSDPSD